MPKPLSESSSHPSSNSASLFSNKPAHESAADEEGDADERDFNGASEEKSERCRDAKLIFHVFGDENDRASDNGGGQTVADQDAHHYWVGNEATT